MIQLIPGKLYFVKDVVNTKKQLQMNVFGYQYRQLLNYLKNNNTFMFVKCCNPEYSNYMGGMQMEIQYFNNVYKTNMYYVFLGGAETYTFVLNPERAASVLEYFQE